MQTKQKQEAAHLTCATPRDGRVDHVLLIPDHDPDHDMYRRCPRPTRARGKSAYIYFRPCRERMSTITDIYFRPCPEGDVDEFKVKRMNANEKSRTCKRN